MINPAIKRIEAERMLSEGNKKRTGTPAPILKTYTLL
jgi:hypothetical protein